MAFAYKKVLVIGATSGIGLAMADKLVQNNVSVIVVGRRKERLEQFIEQHGSDKASAMVFDITKLDQIPQFAAKVIAEHPDLDCVFINSGIQRGFDFSQAHRINVSAIDEEMTTNYTAGVHLTAAFLPYLQEKSQSGQGQAETPTPTALIYTTSQLGLVPLTRCPNYGASKAAMHHFILALRAQLEDSHSAVKVIEIYPPAVQTELHDEKHQPDLKNGHLIGMPLDEFTDEAWTKLSLGDDQIPVGGARFSFDAFELKRQETFQQMRQMMAALLKDVEST